MMFVVTLLCVIALCFALRNPLKGCPAAFYALAILVDVVFLAGTMAGFAIDLPRFASSGLLYLLQKCYLPLSLFAVVMFVGVLPDGSKAKQWLRPVRAELSIVAWILSLGHMTVYLISYAPRMFVGGAVVGNVAVSFVFALLLFALLLVLGVTSFDVVKKHMGKETWKRVQRLAYVFFALVYVHLLLMLMPAALNGGIAARANVVVYSVLFVGYAVLRVYRARRSAAKPQASA